jgi:RNA polymerase sigma factor (sigma-70 family)
MPHTVLEPPAARALAGRTGPPAVAAGVTPAHPVHARSTGALSRTRLGYEVDREALFQDFQPLVRRLIRQYGEDLELRRDLTGEIYCRFCELLDAYDPSRGIPVRAYLVRTLTASVYTFTRSQWRRQHREVSLDATLPQCEPTQCADPSAQWDRDLLTRQVIAALPDTIAALPARQRQVVVWRYYDGRSFEDIAALLHIRPATARSLLRHGLNNLRRQVGRRGLLWE